MSGYIKDRWLWLGLCMTFTTIIGLQVAYLKRTDDVDADENEVQLVQQPSAAAPLSVRTLRTLVDSPNLMISQMATDMVLARLQHAQYRKAVYRLVSADTTSEDPQLRRKAFLALEFWDEACQTPVGSPTASTSSLHEDDSSEVHGTISPSPTMPIAGWTAIPRERPSTGDMDARRLRREAIVLHEGSGEVNEDDIIRPADMH